ncbi:hypothetical protein M409DRAFT_62174 [Zasmidium cellare ATCC 36951]|uniref:PNPLA domain-containing protein n=1 Tax=Zasmidium cellare ATCC 36951 TaxID=1080233 RepID=A0A6A6D3J0_ZASCE|nr:uncharacterized protein M409DRAFT_62174 [Zasmidium cellare ATCC 36951]KAF2173984.1 hypothetical protein M409DRAFT_62174 [Zasmidium cellare ATCC 36951]
MSLLADSNVGEHVARYPQLVSFIGDTNAGKSTIIKILIRRQQLHNSKTTEGEFPSPISGSDAHEKTPTTGDVHLYADPGTARTQFPLLFADCEGLEGGTGEPSAIQFRRNAAARAESAARLVRRPRAIWMRHPRPIEWATSEDKRSRDFVVKELYPRLLYTFSDVTVFVLKNPKTFQSVLKKLIRWGVASLEKSLNVPRLPHAIVVLNMSNVEVDEWNPEIATEAFLNSIGARSGLGDDHEFKTLAANWKRGTDDEITNTYALLHKYYSSFTVVRVPSGAGRFTLLEQQAGVLQRVIEDKCAESFIVKNRYHMPVTSDGVTRYLQAGFDHFAKTLDIPFDFIKAELKNNPLPEDFADHIWALLLMILQLPALQPEQIMDTLGKYVASCIQLDAMQRDEGPVADLFRGYVPSLEAVLTEFRDKHWPCSFKDAKGQACKNSCSGHIAKGHQNEAGKPIGLGTHETNVDFYYYKQKWLAAIENRVMTIDKAVQIPDETSRHGLRAKFRSHILRDFMTKSFDNFRIMGARERFVSHTTCIACLQTIPEHVLPCGHVVCTDCVNIHGKSLSDCVTLIEQCPLHDTDRFVEPWRISTKPRHAGVRVLSLDGGGVRGIIELEVLKAIQDELGGSLSIQAFLDLIVGTSTGGIIALALGTKQWSLARCTDDFLSLCNDAFTKRDPESIPKWMTLFARQSIYKTKPLYGALRKSLGDDLMFGGTHEQQAQFPLKVAVTTHSDIGKGPAIITNYSRPDNSNDEYDLIRSSHPEQEMKVWEAAAATSAAPKYFKTFIHEATDRSFVDGALYWNNPAVLAESERQLLWPDKAAVEPDILLSIGTGQHTAHINEQIAAQDSGNTP